IYVIEELFEEFIEQFTAATKQLVVGSPAEDTTDISAIIQPSEQERAMNWVQESIQNGAEIVTGGTIENGIFMPTILSKVSSTLK
ncbi:aldehyde dehydrogenase family protein, partial [Staphylococcus aureus]|nr:aldehyde dehydrogenase family protein [Staphylococcus aureus]